MKYTATVRRRQHLMDQIAFLTKRHRKRKPLMNLLVKLTNQLLREETRIPRASDRGANGRAHSGKNAGQPYQQDVR